MPQRCCFLSKYSMAEVGATAEGDGLEQTDYMEVDWNIIVGIFLIEFTY